MSSQHRADQHDLPTTSPTTATASASISDPVSRSGPDAATGTSVEPGAGPGVEPGSRGHACSCVSRRQSLAMAGVAVAGTAGLAACGTAEDAVKGAASAAASAGASAAASAAGELIKANQIPVGGGTVFENLKVVVTQPTSGDFKAFSATCPHQGCSVTKVENNVIVCPCHGSEFDATTGDVKQGPATKGLEAKSVSVGADGITVT